MKIQKNVSLQNKNWFKTGGNTTYFAQPKTEKEFAQALTFAQEKNIPIFVLGSGANILISDNGFDGLTIHPQLQKITMTKYKDHVLVKAGAGVVIQNLIDYCLDNNLIGLEEFSHIPGTVGGSAYINIHYFKSFLSDFLETATIIEKQTSNIKTVSKDWFQFGYDTSTLHNKKQYILNATFKLKRANHIKTAYCKGKRDEIIRQRSARYPKTRTCGCFFRNFLEQEIPCTMNNKKIPYTAYYLDKLGIKGDLRFGNAIVSSKHANMIETLPGATSRDVINLAKQMQTLVLEKYGIIPQPECQLIGFKTYPLITV